MIKKILTILLCITLLCPLLTGAAETDDLYFETAEYNESIGFLFAFGILNRESAFIDTDEWTITRGEFTALALECIGIKDTKSYNFENPYLDVSGEHPYVKEILYATNNGYIGDGLGKFFQPDLPLTAEFAARIAINMTGRDIMLRSQNYLSLAIKAHLFDDVQMYGRSNVSRGGAFMFMKNTLTVPLVTYNSISTSGEKGDVRVEEEANLLSSVLKYEKRRGVMTSDGLTTVFGKQPDDGYVTIDNTPYLLLFDSGFGLAGKMVEYYITDYEGRDAVKYIEEYRNDTMTIDTTSINGFDPLNMVYSAVIEGKQRNISVSRTAYIAYNHQPYYDPNYMKPDKGSVTFIDHNGDGVYDVVHIEEFTNIIVDYYSSYAETIFDLTDRQYDIDLSDAKNIFLTDTKNNYIEPKSLSKNSIVSVYKSADAKKIRLVTSTEKITGKLSSIDDEENVTIGEQEFKLSQDFRSTKSELRLGTDYTCFLDARGNIAYMTTQTGVMAYLIKAGTEGTLSKKVQIQVLDEEKKTAIVYNVAEKVRYRTEAVNEKIKAIELLEASRLDSGENFKHTMCLLEFNADGEITSIITAMDIESYNEVFTAQDYPLYKLSYLNDQRPETIGGSSTQTIEYKTAGEHFSRWIVMGSGAKTFYLPELDGEQFKAGYDEEGIIVKSDSFGNGNTQTYNAFYTTDLNDVTVRYMLKYAKGSSSPKVGDSPYLVTSIVGCCHPTYGDCYRITLEGEKKVTRYTKDLSVIERGNFPATYKSGDTTFYGTEEDMLDDDKRRVETGDLVLYSTDAVGRISQFLLLWDSRSNLNNPNVERFGNSTVKFHFPYNNLLMGWKSNVPLGGIIKRKTGSALEIEIDEQTSAEAVVVNGSNVTITNEDEPEKRIQRLTWGKEMKTFVVEFTGKKPIITADVSAKELIPGDRIVLGAGSDSGQCWVAVVYRRQR